ncbi:MAG: hypothetical protein ACK5AW_06995 [Pseudanabaena sp.]
MAIIINHQRDRPITPQKMRSPNHPSKTRSLNKFDNSYCYLLLLQREY